MQSNLILYRWCSNYSAPYIEQSLFSPVICNAAFNTHQTSVYICVYFWSLFCVSVCIPILEPGTFMHGMLMHIVAQERLEPGLPACVTLSPVTGWRWTPDSEGVSERTRDRQGDKLCIKLSFSFIYSESVSSIRQLLAGLQLSQE